MKFRNLIIVMMMMIISSQCYTVYHKISESSLSFFTSWIEIDNNLAIIGTDEQPTNNIVIFVDITNPENPLILEELYNFHQVNNIAIKDSVAYVSDNNSLKLINYNDLNDIMINTYYSDTGVNFVYIYNDYAVFVYDGGFQIINVSNAFSPQEIISIPTGFNIRRAKIIENLLYLLVDDGIKIYDISQINDPLLLGQYTDDFFMLDSFDIYDNKAYIAGWEGLFLVDISDPAEPHLIGSNQNILTPSNISIQDGILYVCDFLYGFSMFDIENFNDLILVNTYSTPRETVHYATQDRILYLLDWSYGLQVVNMDESANPYELNRYFDEFSYIEDLEFTDDYIYYADMMDGLGIYERNNPEEPIYLTGNEMGTSIIYDNDIVYLSYRTGSDFSVGIKIYDVSIPESPELINTIMTDNYQTRKIGDYLIFINGIYSIKILDVSNPSNPTYVSSITNDYHIVSYQIKNNLLFANTHDSYDNIIEIYDISDITNPESISSVSIDYRVFDLNVFEDVLYAGYYNLSWYGSASGYFIIDISDPLIPTIVNEFYVHSPNNRGIGFGSIICNLSGTDLVIADNRSNRLLTYDATDVTNPILQDEFRWNLQTSSLDFDGEILVLNNWVNGITELNWNHFLSVNENVIIAKEILLDNYPNPFNPTTTISFSIPKESKIILSVYNIKGQKVKTVSNNIFQSGYHSLIWNGDNESGEMVSSGVYLYKLNVNGKNEVIKKCMLLK